MKSTEVIYYGAIGLLQAALFFVVFALAANLALADDDWYNIDDDQAIQVERNAILHRGVQLQEMEYQERRWDRIHEETDRTVEGWHEANDAGFERVRALAEDGRALHYSDE